MTQSFSASFALSHTTRQHFFMSTKGNLAYKTANMLLFTESHGTISTWQRLEENNDTNGGTVHRRGSSCASQIERGDSNKAYQAKKTSWLQGNGRFMARKRERLESLYRGATAQIPATELVTTSQKCTSPPILLASRGGP